MCKVAYLVLSIITFSSMANNYGELQVEEVLSVYDGDTFRVNLSGLHPIIGDNIAIRVADIDSPELRSHCKSEKVMANKAKQFVVHSLETGKVVTLRNARRGKYFRIIAEVYIDGISLAETLLEKGLAIEYNGKKKRTNWCK